MTIKKIARFLFFLLLAFALSSCQSISSKKKIDYKSTHTIPPLDVPPDLASLPGDESQLDLQAIPGSAATYSDYVAGRKAVDESGARASLLRSYRDVRLERAGGQRWLVVKAEPEKVWAAAREFLLKNGLLIAREDARTGTMETGWIENRANADNVLLRAPARKPGGLYATGLRDKFRVRLERGPKPGTTEIFLSHRGMEEVVAEGGDDVVVQTVWQPRPSDPGLEAEMLRLLMAHLGLKTEQAKKVLAAAPATERASLNRDRGAPFLSLQDSLDRAWRRVGLSLDRIGFTVEDRDRSRGIYYIRTAGEDGAPEKRGFFSRLFRRKKAEQAPLQFQVSLKASEGGTDVEILSEDGSPANPKSGEKILSLLYEQLK